MGQAVLAPLAVILAWPALTGVDAPAAVFMGAALAAVALSVPLLYGRAFGWPWPVVPRLVLVLVLVVLNAVRGDASPQFWLFQAAMLALAAGSAALARFLARRAASRRG
ncbi:MAG: hypothetical protein JWP20_1894 [Roseomonas sp.]|nr:hypothetical protein [Roseomonas sp.]